MLLGKEAGHKGVLSAAEGVPAWYLQMRELEQVLVVVSLAHEQEIIAVSEVGSHNLYMLRCYSPCP